MCGRPGGRGPRRARRCARGPPPWRATPPTPRRGRSQRARAARWQPTWGTSSPPWRRSPAVRRTALGEAAGGRSTRCAPSVARPGQPERRGSSQGSTVLPTERRARAPPGRRPTGGLHRAVPVAPAGASVPPRRVGGVRAAAEAPGPDRSPERRASPSGGWAPPRPAPAGAPRPAAPTSGGRARCAPVSCSRATTGASRAASARMATASAGVGEDPRPRARTARARSARASGLRLEERLPRVQRAEGVEVDVPEEQARAGLGARRRPDADRARPRRPPVLAPAPSDRPRAGGSPAPHRTGFSPLALQAPQEEEEGVRPASGRDRFPFSSATLFSGEPFGHHQRRPLGLAEHVDDLQRHAVGAGEERGGAGGGGQVRAPAGQ